MFQVALDCLATNSTIQKGGRKIAARIALYGEDLSTRGEPVEAGLILLFCLCVLFSHLISSQQEEHLACTSTFNYGWT